MYVKGMQPVMTETPSAAGLGGVPDAELVSRAGRGDEEAFTEVVHRYEVELLNYFYRHAWDRQVAEDQAQEVFIRLYLHAPTYRPRASFRSYLYKIARSCLIDYLRHVKNHRNSVSLDAPARGGSAGAELVSRDSPGPGEAAENADTVAVVRGAVERLPEEQRDVFLLGAAKGMRYSDVAEVLGVPVGTVKSRMYLAVRRLREKLAGLAPR